MHNRTAFSPDTLKRLSELEERLQYRFHDISLLATALTHSSWANEHNTVHNERLEFLGDAVLEVNVSYEIYKRFPQEREGGMTRLRSRLVSEGKLAELARSLHLGEALFMDAAKRRRAAENARRSSPTPWKPCSAPCISTADTKRPRPSSTGSTPTAGRTRYRPQKQGLQDPSSGSHAVHTPFPARVPAPFQQRSRTRQDLPRAA